ncbi:MAG: DUF2589 domain-containing protein [Agathobacter sp.]|nr:DUF2589 domain-containing protein [Agathobacter sp.]
MEDEKKLKAEDEEKNTKAGVPADSFKGLPMNELISAPLIAVSEAQKQLTDSALDFYNKIAFEDDAKARCLEFNLKYPVQISDSIGTQEVHVEAPFLGLVPIPSLLIDNVDVNFQMEVTDTSTSKNSENADLSADMTPKRFGYSVSVQGKVKASRENTSSTDQNEKYQVSVSAIQRPQAEGLSKLMDTMASCIEPLDKKE